MPLIDGEVLDRREDAAAQRGTRFAVMAELSVRPMTDVEFERWQRHLAEEFAAEQVAAGNWAADEALQHALDGNAALLPDGLATEGMLLLKGYARTAPWWARCGSG
ncbi:hypothetical protein Prum_085600 [Phytohabitans rumicis]|uniref:Uncharacterized protein n=2 Tax=Phytohabitans rumicis TaxID=1076125 RepID=A0A6V8LJ81_9ACTN|nr:hypothetical protein Prum_085600 [Phytohabitans rumicis]